MSCPGNGQGDHIWHTFCFFQVAYIKSNRMFAIGVLAPMILTTCIMLYIWTQVTNISNTGLALFPILYFRNKELDFLFLYEAFTNFAIVILSWSLSKLNTTLYFAKKKFIRKILHTGDIESLDRCG